MTGGPVRIAPVAHPAVAMLARSPRVSGKTRLTGELPEPAATALRFALLLDTMECALSAPWLLHLFLTPFEDQRFVDDAIRADAVLAPAAGRWRVHPQAEGDLGVRMAEAMTRTLAAGHDAVVLVGSDVPALPVTALTAAVHALSTEGGDRRLVFGPASDGGFYLVAGRGAWPEAFAGVAWGRGTVLADVTARARAVALDVTLVEPADDVDVMADLARLLRTQPQERAPRTRQWTRQWTREWTRE